MFEVRMGQEKIFFKNMITGYQYGLSETLDQISDIFPVFFCGHQSPE